MGRLGPGTDRQNGRGTPNYGGQVIGGRKKKNKKKTHYCQEEVEKGEMLPVGKGGETVLAGTPSPNPLKEGGTKKMGWVQGGGRHSAANGGKGKKKKILNQLLGA